MNHEELKRAISSASRSARIEIFRVARKFREDNWKLHPELMARVIPVFQGLIDNEAGEKYFRNHAHLGYALKDLGKKYLEKEETEKANALLLQAEKELTQAIKMRDQFGASGYHAFEFNLVECGVLLKKDKNIILSHLKKAIQYQPLRDFLLSDDKKSKENQKYLRAWLKDQNIDVGTL